MNGSLQVNADARGGMLRVEVVDLTGKPIPPFTLDNCEPMIGDSLRHRFSWKQSTDLSALRGKAVRLRFVLTHAKLFAFWTGEERVWSTPDTTTWDRTRGR